MEDIASETSGCFAAISRTTGRTVESALSSFGPADATILDNAFIDPFKSGISCEEDKMIFILSRMPAIAKDASSLASAFMSGTRWPSKSSAPSWTYDCIRRIEQVFPSMLRTFLLVPESIEAIVRTKDVVDITFSAWSSAQRETLPISLKSKFTWSASSNNANSNNVEITVDISLSKSCISCDGDICLKQQPTRTRSVWHCFFRSIDIELGWSSSLHISMVNMYLSPEWNSFLTV